MNKYTSVQNDKYEVWMQQSWYVFSFNEELFLFSRKIRPVSNQAWDKAFVDEGEFRDFFDSWSHVLLFPGVPHWACLND